MKFHHDTSTNKQITISVKTDHEKSTIEIEDNGIGIDADQQNQIFDMFFRGVHKNAGSGVGLYVAREALKKINGQINIESTPGVGSKFVIEMPNLL
jgi:signal transduction histidine kinase